MRESKTKGRVRPAVLKADRAASDCRSVAGARGTHRSDGECGPGVCAHAGAPDHTEHILRKDS